MFPVNILCFPHREWTVPAQSITKVEKANNIDESRKLWRSIDGNLDDILILQSTAATFVFDTFALDNDNRLAKTSSLGGKE